MVMDRAYSDNVTRELVIERGFIPCVPPKSNRKEPWAYNRAVYKVRNEVERLILRLKKRFRRVFTRYEKLDCMYSAVITVAMIFDAVLC